jgi:hypothetical protein
MGLDMYAATCRQKPSKPVDFEAGEVNELHYWRKHPNLHGWMENLYRQKGGKSDSFNCVNLELLSEDLEVLEHTIINKELPETTGFFFGASNGSEQSDDLEFIRKAREAISNGEFVFYTSWW